MGPVVLSMTKLIKRLQKPSRCHYEKARMQDGVGGSGGEGEGGDKFLISSVTNCKLVMFSLICRACI